MTLLQSLGFTLVFLTLFACQPSTAPAAAPGVPDGPPNVLLLVADDLGWVDLDCYGSPLIESQHLDALARNGVQFMHGYSAAPADVPARAALQTGLRPDRLPATGLDRSHETIGELAQRAGYFTAHIGKWGIGPHPTRQGYDRAFAAGDRLRPDSYYPPYFHGDPFPELRDAAGPDAYLTDVLTDRALGLMQEWRGNPWLISVNYYAPHVPIQGRDDWVQHYRELIASTHWRRFPTLEYAAMVSAMDANIGRLITRLETDGQLENTLIIFTSDNGGLTEAATPDSLARHTPPTDNGMLHGGKGSLYEGGIRVPFIVHYPNGSTETRASLTPVIATDVYPTLAELFGRNDYSPSPDGRSLLPLLQGKEAPERTIRWTHEGVTAERTGAIKTIVRNDSTFRYDLLRGPDERRPLDD